jgi:hypothetical protein
MYSTPSSFQPTLVPHIHVHGGTESHAKIFGQALSIDILYLNIYAKRHGQHINTPKKNDGCTPDQARPKQLWCPISTSMGAQGAMQKNFGQAQSIITLYLNTYAKGHGKHINF